MHDLDFPLCRHASTSLPPLETGGFFGSERRSNVVNRAPGKGAISHKIDIGQSVQVCQDTMSQEHWTRRPYSRRMAENRELEFNEALCARVHRLRNERGWTAEQMATALGVPPERYRKYEYRSPLPHYLVAQFAQIVGRDIEYILTGKIVRQLAYAEEKSRKRA